MQRIQRRLVLTALIAASACAPPPGDAIESPASSARDIALPLHPPPPRYEGPPFRQGPIALGHRTHHVPPDLTGLPPLARASQVILEIQIDARGSVVSARVLRGVRSDVDARVVDAVRQWRYESARLRQAASPAADTTWPVGTAIPVYFTASQMVP